MLSLISMSKPACLGYSPYRLHCFEQDCCLTSASKMSIRVSILCLQIYIYETYKVILMPVAWKNKFGNCAEKINSCIRVHVPGLISEGSTCELTYLLLTLKNVLNLNVFRYFCRTFRNYMQKGSAQRLIGSSFMSSSTDVSFMPRWLAPHFMFYFLPCRSSRLMSFSTLLLRTDSLGETNWWRRKQPAASSWVLWFHKSLCCIQLRMYWA